MTSATSRAVSDDQQSQSQKDHNLLQIVLHDVYNLKNLEHCMRQIEKRLGWGLETNSSTKNLLDKPEPSFIDVEHAFRTSVIS